MRPTRLDFASLVFAAALLIGCASPPVTQPAPPTSVPAPPAAIPEPAPPPAPAPPQAPAPSPSPTQQELDSAAQRDMDEAIAFYDKGDYSAAIDRFVHSAAIAIASTPIRVTALKYAAFSYCVTRRSTLCRTHFEAAFKLDPAFDLSPAERGHPLWGPVFDRVKRAQAQQPKK